MSFDAFICYRRSDGNVFAQRLRRLLRDFRTPRQLRSKTPPSPLNVYVDTIYEQATNDFFERVTLPALLASRFLIVVATPDAVDRGADHIDWIRREIRAFEQGPNAGNIIVVRAKDPADGPLPGDLAQRYPNIEIIDLRGLSPLSFLNPIRAARLADETVKLLAPLLGFSTEDMPALRQEEERRQQVRLGALSGGATALIVTVATLATLAFHSRNRAVDALSRSVFATDRVIQSVSGSLQPGQARSNLLASTCDLLDSLRDQSTAAPRANALVLCAVERAESHQRLGEGKQAAELVRWAANIARDQYQREETSENALATLIVRRAQLERAISGVSTESASLTLSELVAHAKELAERFRSERNLSEFAAQTLQTAAVSLAEKRQFDAANIAVSAAIDLWQIALDRGAEFSTRFDQVLAVSLAAEIYRMNGKDREAADAATRARALFAEISADEADAQELTQRYQAVRDSLDSATEPSSAPK